MEVARQIRAPNERPDPPAIPVARARQGRAMTGDDVSLPPRESPLPHRVEAAETAPISRAAVAFFFEQCQAQLERQMRDVDAMDAKAVAVATAGTLLLAVVPGTRFAAAAGAALSVGALAALIAASASYLGVLIAVGLALRISQFHFPPAPRDIFESYLRVEPELSKLTIAMDMMAKYEENRDRIARKQRRMFAGLVLVAVESLVLLGGLVIR